MRTFLETLDRPAVMIGPVGSRYPTIGATAKLHFDFDHLAAIIVPRELSPVTWEKLRMLAPDGFALKPGLGKRWGVWAVLSTGEWASAHKDQDEPKPGLIITIA